MFKFGIYRGAAPKGTKDSTHVVYYDEIRYVKKSCKKLKLKDLGYTCKELESQKLKKIHTIEKVEKIDWSKCDEEGLAHKPLICYGSDGKLIPKSERIKN